MVILKLHMNDNYTNGFIIFIYQEWRKMNNLYADHSYFSILYILYKQKNKIVITSAAIYIVVKVKFILKYNITATKCKIVSIIEKQFS